MPEITAAIIGGGPRALTLLERIAAKASRMEAALTLHILDPGIPGEGSHAATQCAFLLTNTVASQVTVFPHNASDDPASAPSFTQWARGAGFRRFGDRFVIDAGGEAISDDDYLPRSLLGAYLGDCARRLAERLPPHVRLIHQRATATDMVPEGRRHRLMLDGERSVVADYVFLATGHCRNVPDAFAREMATFADAAAARNPRASFIADIYPTKTLDAIDPEAVVAVQGLGLTAYDAVAALTIGRGGVFEGTIGALRYKKTGREPKILLFSRQGLPYAARGRNQKGIAGKHEATVFTPDAVDRLRDRTPGGILDFESDLLPLLKEEMLRAFLAAEASSPREATAGDRDHARALVDRLFGGAGSYADMASFTSAMLGQLRSDLAEALRGNLNSPIKAATDVIRDCRPAIAAAVENRGLHAESHRWFVETFTPTMNRLAFGPPRIRNAQLIALIEAGCVGWAGGPGCQVFTEPGTGCYRIVTRFADGSHNVAADVVVVARLPLFRPREDASPLYRNLLRRGTVRPFINDGYHPGGLDLDHRLRPVDDTGSSLPNVWAVGYPSEGPRFYTHALPRPLRRSVQSSDADLVVEDFLKAVAAAEGATVADAEPVIAARGAAREVAA